MVATQLTVTIRGGGPYGLRLGSGTNQQIVVDKVRKNGKADEVGLKEGDLVLTINGRSCSGLDSATASQMIDSSGQELTIQVTRGTSSETGQSMIMTTSTMTTTTKEFNISAPSGVDVQKNEDSSFTMTIGMPFELNIGDAVHTQQQQQQQHRQEQHIVVASHKPTDESQQQQVQPVEATVEQTSVETKAKEKRLERILSAEGSEGEPSTPDGKTRSSKKLFVDSAFYDDPEHKYPTVGEQIQLARQVAMSVISPANLKSKGHKMFMRRKERAIRWTTGLTEEEKAELIAQTAPAKAAEGSTTTSAAAESDEEAAAAAAFRTPPTAPSLLPFSVAFAPKLPTEDRSAETLNAMSSEELERMYLQERKMTHTNVSPQVCFNLADDLKNLKGKGGKLFAKRQAKAETWDKAKSAGGEEGEETGEASPEVTEKIKAQHRMTSSSGGNAGTGGGGGSSPGPAAPPVNRLKEMVEMQKAAMTPWDAVAQYGTVDKAFEHLDAAGKQTASKSIADNIQHRQKQQQQPRRGDATGASSSSSSAARRPVSTIGCVGGGGGWSEKETKNSENEQKTKIETVGGNPNAAGLAAAMNASLGASRSGQGFRSVKFKPT